MASCKTAPSRLKATHRFDWSGRCRGAGGGDARHPQPRSAGRVDHSQDSSIAIRTSRYYGGNRVAEFERRFERRFVLKRLPKPAAAFSRPFGPPARPRPRRCGPLRAFARAVDGRGRYDDRGQIRATASNSRRSGVCWRSRARCSASSGLDRDDLSRAACATRGVTFKPARFYRFGKRAMAGGAGG